MCFKKTAILILTSLLSFGCASVATKGRLEPVSFLPKPSKKIEIFYRTYILTPRYENKGASIRPATVLKEMLQKAILKWDGLMVVHEAVFETREGVSINDENYQEKVDDLMGVNFPIKEDYFLKIEQREKPMIGANEGMMYWGMFHLLSLGLIPLRADNDINLVITLYDKKGKLLQREEIGDESKIWAWSPQFFYNGFHMFRSMEEVAAPVRKNALENGLARLKF